MAGSSSMMRSRGLRCIGVLLQCTHQLLHIIVAHRLPSDCKSPVKTPAFFLQTRVYNSACLSLYTVYSNIAEGASEHPRHPRRTTDTTRRSDYATPHHTHHTALALTTGSSRAFCGPGTRHSGF